MTHGRTATGLAIALASGAAFAAPRPAARCDTTAPLYIAPMGQPFRGANPTAAWFAQADSDHDGRLTRAEFTADAMRFFATLDRNHDGEIDPQEIIAYEGGIPEIRLYQRTPQAPQGKSKRSKGDYADQPIGAGRFSQLNIPEPVAAADADLNRGISADEFARAAADRFARLDPATSGVLTLAGLAPTPAQGEAAACAAKLAKKRG